MQSRSKIDMAMTFEQDRIETYLSFIWKGKGWYRIGFYDDGMPHWPEKWCGWKKTLRELYAEACETNFDPYIQFCGNHRR